MNKKTIAALIAGAEKWERNALVSHPDDAEIYSDSCALCKMFKGCDACPVQEKTAVDGCIDTPWERADAALDEWALSTAQERRNARARFRRASIAEAKFLRSLIPAEAA